MSYPILYSPTETNFNHNGLGILSSCVSCEVSEEANGAFELSMQYPMDGIHYNEITYRSIIKAKADQIRDPQLFRVYSFSRKMNGIVKIQAHHISYDLSGIPVKTFSASSAPEAMEKLSKNAIVDCPFSFVTDKSTIANLSVNVPGSIRSKLGGSEGSILDVYGGEYEFDNYSVVLHNQRGRDRGFLVKYGKNLTSLKQDQNCSNVATGVYPYWVNAENGTLVELPEKIVNAPGTYDFVKIKTVDFSGDFQEEPSEEQLRERTNRYIESNDIGVPAVSMKVSFAQLSSSEEYKHLKLFEEVQLFDTVKVEFPEFNVFATSKVNEIVYDVIFDRVVSISLGSVKANIADTLAKQDQTIKEKPNLSDVQRVSSAATAWLTNGKGYKVERRDDSGNVIDTLYMDAPDIDEAVNVMRIGQSGIGFSNNGVNGPYYSAWTIDGVFDASWIKAGVLTSQNGNIAIDLYGNTMNISVSSEDRLSRGFEFTGSGFWGYGEDSRTGEIHPTMVFTPAVTGPGTTSESVLASGYGTDLSLESLSYVDSNGTVQPGGYVCLGSFSGSKVKIKDKIVSWKDNGDGTFTLIGQ